MFYWSSIYFKTVTVNFVSNSCNLLEVISGKSSSKYTSKVKNENKRTTNFLFKIDWLYLNANEQYLWGRDKHQIYLNYQAH